MASNVKTGDLAWWMVREGTWPICTVGNQASAIRHEHIDTNIGPICGPEPEGKLYWWCVFPSPVVVGTLAGLNIQLTASLVPIADVRLKKITGPDVDTETLTVDGQDLIVVRSLSEAYDEILKMRLEKMEKKNGNQ